MTIEEAKVQMRRLTRVFVRRQANWFKTGDPMIKWFVMGEKTQVELEGYLRGQLS
jgi:tRNA dimethylallyltransferase